MEKSKNRQGVTVLIAGAALQLFLGILYVWSVFVGPVSEALNWGVDQVKLTSSFMLCFFVIGIFFGGKLMAKIGSQTTVLIGGLMLAFGMLATAFIPVQYPWLIYVTYGIIGGFGVGAGYNSIISAAQKWFPKNRGFATGFSVCAFGFSTVIFAPLIENCIKIMELKNTLMLLAGIFLVMVLALFSFIKTPKDTETSNAVAYDETKQFTMGQMLKRKEFYFITLSMMFVTAPFFILNPSFKIFAAERGLTPNEATIMIMVTGVANALGRLGAPLLSDKIGREKAILTIILATAVSCVFMAFIPGYAFIGFVAIAAFCYGGTSGIYPVITADYFGLKNVGSNYGAVMMGFALSALTFPMILGTIKDITMLFVVLTAIALAAALCIVMLMMSKKKK